MGNLFWRGNLGFTSNPCQRRTIWQRSIKFWYTKRQSILFRGKSISNLCFFASLRKSLIESHSWGGWPCMLYIFFVFDSYIWILNLLPNTDFCISKNIAPFFKHEWSYRVIHLNCAILLSLFSEMQRNKDLKLIFL